MTKGYLMNSLIEKVRCSSTHPTSFYTMLIKIIVTSTPDAVPGPGLSVSEPAPTRGLVSVIKIKRALMHTISIHKGSWG